MFATRTVTSLFLSAAVLTGATFAQAHRGGNAQQHQGAGANRGGSSFGGGHTGRGGNDAGFQRSNGGHNGTGMGNNTSRTHTGQGDGRKGSEIARNDTRRHDSTTGRDDRKQTQGTVKHDKPPVHTAGHDNDKRKDQPDKRRPDQGHSTQGGGKDSHDGKDRRTQGQGGNGKDGKDGKDTRWADKGKDHDKHGHYPDGKSRPRPGYGYWPSRGYKFVPVVVLGERFGMRLSFLTEGLVLGNIRSGGLAARCGLSAGDIIEQVDDIVVATQQDWNDALESAEETITLKVRKAGSNEVLDVEVPAKVFVEK